MKNIYQFALMALFVLMGFTACDFLDKEPLSDLSEGVLGIDPNSGDSIKYKTAEAAEQLLSSAYTGFGGEFWQLDWYVINDAQSDNAYAGEPGEPTAQSDEYRLDAANERVERDWSYCYAQIAKTNSVIQWVPLVPDPNLTETRKKEIVAEASFIRAFAYFNLVRMYGDVPLVIQEVPSINMDNLDEIYPLLYPARVSSDSVYMQILTDLEYALQYAPDYSDNKFKVTKALVNLVMAQVYSTKDGIENTDWGKVKQYASAAANNSHYQLLANYNDLFSVTPESNGGNLTDADLDHENSAESLFEVNYTDWSNLGNWGCMMFYGTDWKKFNTPSHDLLDAFDREGDIIRKNASVKFENVTGSWSDQYWSPAVFPFCFKLRAAEKGNIILFRLPEAILLLAEAENETGNASEAKRLLNMVRNRVQLSNTTATSQSEIRFAIENEHRLEFAFEGKRWFDLLRRGRAIQVMQNCSDHQKNFAVANLTPNKLVWPVPQSERDLNLNLTQNTGY